MIVPYYWENFTDSPMTTFHDQAEACCVKKLSGFLSKFVMVSELRSLLMAVINIASIAQINKVNQMLATFVINISFWEFFLSGAHNVVQKTNVCLEDCVCKPTSN